MTDEEKAEATLRAQALLDEGWYQVSRNHRMLARLPEGKTGMEALIDAENESGHPHPDLEEWAHGLGEAHAGDSFLRCHAMRLASRFPDEFAHLSKTLDSFTFNEWRRLGGETYMSKHWKIHLTETESRELFRTALLWADAVPGKPLSTKLRAIHDVVAKLKEKYAHAIEGSHI